jgi:hypothetical protein
MTAPLGLALSGDPMLHFAGRLDVVAWSAVPVDDDR